MAEKEFDENDAVAAIRQALSQQQNEKYSNDDLLLVLDTISDYFDNCDDESDQLVEELLVDYVTRQLRRDKECPIESDDVPTIVSAELDYEDSLAAE